MGSVVVAHGLSSCGSWALEHRLSSCGARAYLLCDMWDLPGPGLESVSLALAGGFLTTAPPEKSLKVCLIASGDPNQGNIFPGHSAVHVQSAITSLIPVDFPTNLVWQSF